MLFYQLTDTIPRFAPRLVLFLAPVAEELIETVIGSIRARFGDYATGLGDHGIRFVGGRQLGAPGGTTMVMPYASTPRFCLGA